MTIDLSKPLLIKLESSSLNWKKNLDHVALLKPFKYLMTILEHLLVPIPMCICKSNFFLPEVIFLQPRDQNNKHGNFVILNETRVTPVTPLSFDRSND
jgi:hypothetical protein